MRGRQVRGRAAVVLLATASVLLLVAAVAVRGLDPGLPPRPEDEAPEGLSIERPMQLLGSGARVRIDELTHFVAVERLLAWEDSRSAVFEIETCPLLTDWLDTTRGQEVERLCAGLERGSREEALAALALLFQVARSTRWRIGLWSGDAADAEHLGALLEEWLRRWADGAASDPLLAQPALAAVLLYGQAMKAARDAPRFATNDAAEARARLFLDELTGRSRGSRTAFGEALQARYPRAYGMLARDEDPLAGLSEECALSFPELNGTCDG